jgi:hypothetical protein
MAKIICLNLTQTHFGNQQLQTSSHFVLFTPCTFIRSHISQSNKMHTSYLLYNITFFAIKSIRHVSVPYYGTIIRDLYLDLHKFSTQVMVHIKGQKCKMWGFLVVIFGPTAYQKFCQWKARTVLS